VTPQDWAAFFVAIFTLVGGLAAAVRWMVKHYLAELKPNGGSSLKDSVNRLEAQVEQIMIILMTQNVKPKRKVTPKE
jgi:H+/Cl- antiporter ClcA